MLSLYQIYLRERRGSVAALYVLSLLGFLASVAVVAFWSVGGRLGEDLRAQLGAGTVVVAGGDFTEGDLARALSLGCFSEGYGVSFLQGVLVLPNGTRRGVVVGAVPSGVMGASGAAATAFSLVAERGDVVMLEVEGRLVRLFVNSTFTRMFSLMGFSADVYVDRSVLGVGRYGALVLRKAGGGNCLEGLRALFPKAAVMDSDFVISALWGQLLVYLAAAGLVAVSVVTAVAALIYTLSTTLYFLHFKEFAVLRVLGLKKRGLLGLVSLLFFTPVAAGVLTGVPIALAAAASSGLDPALSVGIPAAVLLASSTLASLPALRRLYALSPAAALRYE
ncbi:hypothetical protein [Pyrobaculum ferrireducens]|uniref:ABC3 transporter permease protein domain-containing protein n=1 Tax=Pyrobaculum ferrireducens TaxID=1104324 RepID=G7VD63_9CREN|nr:hypothetical protein [Pyrobaculum ferrireducens]AET33942.1 hypothetical protein P186_2558 [Pyrobaculum ferrireducens]